MIDCGEEFDEARGVKYCARGKMHLDLEVR